MPNPKVSLSRQLIRPSKLQASVFILSCGLSSMIGAFATALFMEPTLECSVSHPEAMHSEQLATQPCHSLDIHSRMNRAAAQFWFSSTSRHHAEVVQLTPKNLGSGLIGLTLSNIGPGTIYHDVGLKDGDTIASVEGIHLFSSNSDRLLREKLFSDATESISMALLRDGCPATLEVHLQ